MHTVYYGGYNFYFQPATLSQQLYSYFINLCNFGVFAVLKRMEIQTLAFSFLCTP